MCIIQYSYFLISHPLSLSRLFFFLLFPSGFDIRALLLFGKAADFHGATGSHKIQTPCTCDLKTTMVLALVLDLLCLFVSVSNSTNSPISMYTATLSYSCMKARRGFALRLAEPLNSFQKALLKIPLTARRGVDLSFWWLFFFFNGTKQANVIGDWWSPAVARIECNGLMLICTQLESNYNRIESSEYKQTEYPFLVTHRTKVQV